MAFFHFCREADFMNMKCKQKLGGSPNFFGFYAELLDNQYIGNSCRIDKYASN